MRRAAGISKRRLSDEVNQRLVLELYRERRVSLGAAAELAGLTIDAFLELMEHFSTYLNYGSEDLVEDRVTLR